MSWQPWLGRRFALTITADYTHNKKESNSRNALLLLILLTGFWLRGTAWSADLRFHGDEALFATFARGAALNGEWLFPGALDKPPLALYAMALAMLPFVTPGPSDLPNVSARAGELAARLPGLMASWLLIPTAFVLARRLYGPGPGPLLTAALVSFSPLAVAYGPTAFTDSMMLLWGGLALYAAAADRPGSAGVLLALSAASKQQAVFLLPLVVGMGWAMGRADLRRLVSFTLTLGIGLGLFFGWDALRSGQTSVMALAIANNDPARWVQSNEVWPRLSAWVRHLMSLYAPVSALLIPLAAVSVGIRTRWGWARSTRIDWVLLCFCSGYLLVHWLVAFNVYERYLLLLLIPLSLLAARALITLRDALAARLPPGEANFIGLLFLVTMTMSAHDAAQGRLGLSLEGERLRGIDHVAAVLDAYPLGTILYDRWLGWELDYYLGEWTDKRRVYYPTPQLLAEDALRQADPAPRYFIVPPGVDPAPWLQPLAAAGFSPTLEQRVERVSIYRLTPP